MDRRVLDALRRRRDAREHPAAHAQARPRSLRRVGGRMSRFALPRLRLRLRRGRPATRARASRPARPGRGAGRLGLPGLRRARQGRLRAATRTDRPSGGCDHGGDGPRDATHPYAVAARELLRDTLFDAARDELQQRAWAEITMADVATRRPGSRRQTLYKEFGTRDEFAQAFVMREGERFLDAVEQAVREHLDDPPRRVGRLRGLPRAAGEDPLMRPPAQRRRHRRHAAARHDPGHARRRRGRRARSRRHARRLAAGAPSTTRSCSPRASCGSRSATWRCPRDAAGDGRAVAALLGPFIERALGGGGRRPA